MIINVARVFARNVPADIHEQLAAMRARREAKEAAPKGKGKGRKAKAEPTTATEPATAEPVKAELTVRPPWRPTFNGYFGAHRCAPERTPPKLTKPVRAA